MAKVTKHQNEGAESTQPQEDIHGNPVGTTYSHTGEAIAPEGYNEYEGGSLRHLPVPPEGTEYDTDGSFFKLPEDYGKVMQALKEEIAGYKLAITQTETAIEGARKIILTQPADMQHLFEGAITSQQTKIDSDKEFMEVAKVKLDEYMLTLEKPSVRNAKRELATVQAEIAKLKIREAELLVLCGATGASMTKKGEPSSNKVTHTRPAGTDEQKANLEAGLAAHGDNQGKLIVAAVKMGWKNNKIANFYGIPDANVPGPKNKFLRSEEGIKWQAENPGVLESIGLEAKAK